MRRLLLGDFCRIIQKKSFWIVLFLYTVYMLVTIYGDYHGDSQDWVAPVDNAGVLFSGLGFLMGIVLMLGVYGDEFRSMTMIAVIGRGTSRVKYVISKFLLCVIMMLLAYVVSGGINGIAAYTYDIPLTALGKQVMLLVVVSKFLCVIACLAMAAVFMYLTGNTPLGMFAFIVFYSIAPFSLFMLDMMPQFQRIHFEGYYLMGIVNRALTDLVLGVYGEALLFGVIGVGGYIGGALAISIAVFGKKELEF